MIYSRMNIQKANWHNSENRVNISFPIAKVDKEKRTVSGFATLDNVDRHGDIVTSEASERAFARFRGNLREMHQPIAIGKVLSFHPEDYFDKKSGKAYKGIYVNAYVSKGAQDTWEKVLDGTLTGFSIGGNIINAAVEPGEDDDRRVIKEYDLMELSLVDSPANPLANIFSIQKVDDAMVMKGMATEVLMENVFWCSQDQIASTSYDTEKNCVICDSQMSNIGWVESADTEKSVSVQKVIDDYLAKDTINSGSTINAYPDQNKVDQGIMKSVEGGNEMADEIVNEETHVHDENCGHDVVEAVADEAVAEPAVEEAPAEEAVEKSVTSAESTDSFAKMLTDLRDLFGEAINKNSADSSEAMQKSIDSVRSEVSSSVEELKKEIQGIVEVLGALSKRFEAYENDTAVKKSVGEVENAPKDTKLSKSIWQGSFLGVQNL